MYKTIQEIKDKNLEIDNHWFDASTMRFFDSKIITEVLKDRFFITQETGPAQFFISHRPNKETYSTLRMARDCGRIDTVGKFHSMDYEQCMDLLNSLPAHYYEAYMYFVDCFNNNTISAFLETIAIPGGVAVLPNSHSLGGACAWLMENAEMLGDHCLKNTAAKYLETINSKEFER